MAGHADDSPRAAREGGSLRSEKPEILSEILGLVIHDLRNPLAALSSNVGFLQMISREMSDDAQEAVEDLLLSIEGIGRIIDSLELVSHDLGERRPGSSAKLTVNSVLRALGPSAERAAKSYGLSLEWDVAEMKQARFVAIEPQFSRALASLVHNALTVAPSRSTVRVRVLQRDSDLVFRVEDQGAALTPEMAERVRSPQQQNLIKADRQARYSRGLGLFITNRFAELAKVEFVVGQVEVGSALELVTPTLV